MDGYLFPDGFKRPKKNTTLPCSGAPVHVHSPYHKAKLASLKIYFAGMLKSLIMDWEYKYKSYFVLR